MENGMGHGFIWRLCLVERVSMFCSGTKIMTDDGFRAVGLIVGRRGRRIQVHDWFGALGCISDWRCLRILSV